MTSMSTSRQTSPQVADQFSGDGQRHRYPRHDTALGRNGGVGHFEHNIADDAQQFGAQLDFAPFHKLAVDDLRLAQRRRLKRLGHVVSFLTAIAFIALAIYGVASAADAVLAIMGRAE